MLPRNLGRRFERIMLRAMKTQSLNSGPVTLRWREAPIPPPGFDPLIASTASAMEWIQREETALAFIHYVQAHTTTYQAHATVKAGDVILDFPGSIQIDDLEDLRFIIDGQIFTQKRGGESLAKSWDTRCGSTPITRTVLVTPLA